MPKLWTPGDKVPVEPHKRRVQPTERKAEGGSQFDDELETAEAKQARIEAEAMELMSHINARPDHNVYVSSHDEREKMRDVFKLWRHKGYIRGVPKIKIEYGVPAGGIRVAP